MIDRSGRNSFWSNSFRRTAKSSKSKRSPARNRPALDALEPRTLLSGTPVGVDLGDFYYHFDQRIPLQRAADQMLVQVDPTASGGVILADLTRPEGPLADYEFVATTNPAIFTVTRTTPGEGTPAEQRAALLGLIEQVSAEAGVQYVAESFIVTTAADRVQATSDIYAAIAPGVDPATVFVTPLFSGYRPVLGTHDQFIATATTEPGPATLTLANQLQESDARIAWSTPNFFITVQRQRLDDPLLSTAWHLNNTGQNGGTVGADAKVFGAWDLGATGEGIVIAVIDDAIQWDHPDLITHVFANPGEIAGNGTDDDGNGWIDDVYGWDFTDNDNDARPNLAGDNHGTAVSGVALASGDNAIGSAGAAYRASLMPVRLPLGRPATIDQFTSPVYYASGRTADGLGTWKAADVLNHSYGGASPFPGWETAFNWSATNGRGGLGAVNFAATGNDGVDRISYPAAFASTIAVGGSTDGDIRVTYSQWGPEIDFVTPTGGLGWNGIQNIQTTDRTGTDGYAAGDYTGIGTTGFNGTSSSTPLAAGIGALVLHANPLLSFDQVRQVLRSTSDKIGGVTYNSDGFHIQYGYGRLNAARAVREVTAKLEVQPPQNVVENQIYVNLPVATLDFIQAPASLNGFTAEIDFGDGSDPVAGRFTPIGDNQFRIEAVPDVQIVEGGTFTMTVRVLSEGSLVATGTGALVVGDLPITSSGVEPIVRFWENVAFTGTVATFEDTDPDVISAGSYNVVVDWGFGQILPGAVVALDGHNRFEVQGTHDFGGGEYPITITITGPGGGTSVAITQARIEDAPLEAQAVPIIAPEGMLYSGVIATFTDLDVRDLPASDYKAQIDWGDGPYASPNVDRPIQDRADRPLVSTLVVDKGPFTIADLNLNLDISHARVGDLTAILRGPDGTTITLFAKPSTHGPDFNGVTFDDQASRSIDGAAAPFSGSYSPLQALSAFDGKQLGGTWTLTITDDTPGFVGRLNSWSLAALAEGEILATSPRNFEVVGDHVFALRPDQVVTIAITASDISSALVTSQVEVLNQAVSTRGIDIKGVEGDVFSGVIGLIVDANPRSNVGDFIADVILPEGRIVPLLVTSDGGGRYALAGNFAFDRPSPVVDGVVSPVPLTVRIREVGQAPGDPALTFEVNATIENPPIVATSASFVVTEGQPFSGVIARFQDGNLTARAEDYDIIVDWAGGLSSGPPLDAVVIADPEGQPGDFLVVTAVPVLYGRAGVRDLSVAIRDPGTTNGSYGQEVILGVQGVVTDAPLLLTPADLSNTFTERTSTAPVVIGTFVDTNPSGLTGVLQAAVNWGDGRATSARVEKIGDRLYQIVAEYVYQDPGLFTAWIVVGSNDGAASAMPATVVVADKITELTGTLDPASDRGASAGDWITNVRNPTFRGAIVDDPGAIVQLFVEPAGGGARTPVGFGIADAQGNWQAPIISLADGAYHVYARAVDRQSRPGSEWTPLTTANRPLVIDTVSPRITSAYYDTRISAFRITFADNHSGISHATVLNPALYSLAASSRPMNLGAPVLSLDPADPNTVLARFQNTRAARNGQVTLTIQTHATTDNAGNRVDERYYIDFPGTQRPPSPIFIAQYNLLAAGPLIGPRPYAPPEELFGAARFNDLVRASVMRPRRF